MDWRNNASERNIKRLVLGRKNWLFSTSPAGARSTAIWLTLIESAKANGIDPRAYITYLLKDLPQQPDFADPAQLAVYLPWHYPSTRHQNKKSTAKHEAKNAA